MTTRKDTLVSGPIPQNSMEFYFGGFMLTNGGLNFGSGFSLYCYGPSQTNNNKIFAVSLFEGWYDLGSSSKFTPLKLKWSWAWDMGLNIPNGIRYPVVFYTMINSEAYYLVSNTGTNPSNNDLLTLRTISDIGNNTAVFDLNDQKYDWMDGTMQLQTGNILIPGSKSGVRYSSVYPYKSTGTTNDIPTGGQKASNNNFQQLNFLPLSNLWQTKTGVKMDDSNSTLLQQCYRYQQLGKQVGGCPDTQILANYVGVTDYSNAVQSKYMPYYVSNKGCGADMSALGQNETVSDLLGNVISDELSCFGTATGYCVRNNDKFTIESNNGSDGHKCPPGMSCADVANNQSCQGAVCGKCNIDYCPRSFDGYVLKDTSLTDSKNWIWVLMGAIILLVLCLIGFAFYSRSYKDSLPDSFWENPGANYDAMMAERAPNPSDQNQMMAGEAPLPSYI
jgi:hypothetical protein